MENQLGKILPCSRRLYTRNLLLRRLVSRDASPLSMLIKDNLDYLLPWLPPFPPKFTLNSVEDWIADEHRLLRRGERIDLGVFLEKSRTLLGRVSLHSIQWGIQRSGAVSYWLDKEHAGKGYATEAAATMISFAFEEMRLHRIYVDILPENKPSLAMARKLGFRSEGLSKKALFLDGRWHDVMRFALLEEEYDCIAETWIKKGYLGV